MKKLLLFLLLSLLQVSFVAVASTSDLTPTHSKELIAVPEMTDIAVVNPITTETTKTEVTSTTTPQKTKKKITLKELRKALKKPATQAGNPDGLAVASMATGVGGLSLIVLALLGVPILGWLALAACICGIIFGAMAKKRGTSKRGMATAGLICGIIGCAIFLIGYLLLLTIIASL